MLPQAVQFFCYEDKQELPYLLCRLVLHCLSSSLRLCLYEFGLRLFYRVPIAHLFLVSLPMAQLA